MGSQHFSDVEWADFVRGLASGPVWASMEAHLASGCVRCRRAADALGTVAGVAKGEAAFEVPLHLLRWAAAVFSLRQPERVQILPRVSARLVFDSFGGPQPVGVRSQERVSRQAMYRAGDYYVDLRLESEPGTHRVSLVGQIADAQDARGSVGNVPVVLAAGGDVLARTVSNEFGEFQMSYEPGPHLRLSVPVGAERRIEVPLSRLSPGKGSRSRGTAGGCVTKSTGRPR